MRAADSAPLVKAPRGANGGAPPATTGRVRVHGFIADSEIRRLEENPVSGGVLRPIGPTPHHSDSVRGYVHREQRIGAL